MVSLKHFSATLEVTSGVQNKNKKNGKIIKKRPVYRLQS